MRIPPFWARARYEGTDSRGRSRTFVGCGWSFSSLQEAKNDASARARRIFELITRGERPDRYEYHDRPIKEEIVEEISDDGARIAVVTRNRYGALVLNCSSVLFVDVDFPRLRPAGILQSVMLAFSCKKREAKRQAVAQSAIQRVEKWAGDNPDHAFRLYRTREGLRLLFTDNLYDPMGEDTASLLFELKADPLYVKLTQKQECFRARLTSKPWRCGSPRPPSGFPWDDAEAERAFRQWEAVYEKRDSGFKACELVREFGTQAEIASLRTIVDIHDRESRITADAPLA
jgi:hypothetical protein